MKLYLILFLSLIFNMAFGQVGALKDAVRQGKNRQNMYTVKFKEPESEQKVASWIKKNGYVPVNVDRKTVFKFGDYYTGVSYVEFMTKADSDALLAQIAREANERERLALERARREQEQNSEWSLGDIGKVIVAGAILVGAAALAYDAVSSSYSSGNYQNNSSDPHVNLYQILSKSKNSDVKVKVVKSAYKFGIVRIYSRDNEKSIDQDYYSVIYNKKGEKVEEFSNSLDDNHITVSDYHFPIRIDVSYKTYTEYISSSIVLSAPGYEYEIEVVKD